MNAKIFIAEALMICCLAWQTCCAEEGANASARGEEDRQFANSAPYGSAAEISSHFGYSVPLPDYDLKVEKFRLFVPETYSTNTSWGLLVWISPENEGRVPKSLTSELASHRL